MKPNIANRFLLPVKEFADILSQGQGAPVWVHYAPFGRWSHPTFGTTYMTVDKAHKMVKNFNDNVRGIDIMTDYEHGMDPAKGNKASGQIVKAEVRGDGLWTLVKFTTNAVKEIKDGEWKYWSPSFHERWTNPMDDVEHEAVIEGGALTNKPWIKGMVPLNFSEHVTDPDPNLAHYRINTEGEKDVVEIKMGDEDWRIATVDECAEWEHSEPGTGSPPPPRLDEDDRSGDRNGSGSRRPTPPPEPEGYPENHSKEGSVVKLKKEVLDALGITPGKDDEVDETVVEERVLAMFSELKPLKDAEATRSREKSFAEQFPVEFAEMQRGRNDRLTTESKRFSEQFERLTIGEGDDAKKSTRGLSGLALDQIAEAHKAFNEGTPEGVQSGLKLFGEALTTITSDKGIVDYGEGGSSREVNDNGGVIPSEAKEVKKAFAELATKKQVEAGGATKMSWGDAVSAAAAENPQLAKAYSELSNPQA